MGFPIDQRFYRKLEDEFEGEVFIGDIDRTYLATRFSSLKGIARIPFETAAEKQDIAGMGRLFREIRRGPSDPSRQTPLYFVSASPPQLRPVIERKMKLDGIDSDGTTFKSWLGVVAGLRLRRLKEQVGFKLTALLAGRAELPVGAHEVLIGDDLETDAVAFCLYADLLARRIDERQFTRALVRNAVAEDDARSIVDARASLPDELSGVKRAYIRLERYTDPAVFRDFAPNVVACRGAFQLAVALWGQGSISGEGVGRVALGLLGRDMSRDVLADRLRECCRRALLPPDAAAELGNELAGNGILPKVGDLGEPDPSWLDAAERFADNPDRAWTPDRFVGV